MAHDFLRGNTSRSWARDTVAVPPAPKQSTGQKVVLGLMASGTIAGIAFLTQPWWRRIEHNNFVPNFFK